jgi:hypothetical protein
MTATPPEWLPPIGTTVYLKVVGSRRKPVAYEIREYKEFSPGEWVFKAISPRGVGITDSIDILL